MRTQSLPSRRPVEGSKTEQSEIYHWFKAASNYTARADEWIVVIGAGFPTGGTTDTDLIISVTSPANEVIDEFQVSVRGASPPGFEQQGLPRTMLCPPGYTVNTRTLQSMSLISTRKLEDAVALL